MVIRERFDNDLKLLQQDILRMGSLVERAIARAVEALADRDVQKAQQVIFGDDTIDNLEVQVETDCMRLIATQQPMAKDLRRIGAGFKIIADLERMGDHASDIAKITLRLADQPLVKPLIDIPRMAKLTQQMVKDSLDAYVNEDVNLAYTLADMDDQVDRLHKMVFDELAALMEKYPEKIRGGIHLLFVSRHLERIADHSTNIGERVIYLATGEIQELN